MKLGNNAKNSGGEWQTDVNDTYQIIGTRFQTYRQKQYALQYGSYFALADGTHGTNKYGMTIFPWVTTGCLGYTQLVGLSTGLSENTVDVVAAGYLFGIASMSTTQHVSTSFHNLVSVAVIVMCMMTFTSPDLEHY